MAQNTLIYVAGNPGLYPLEYYDSETGSYMGAIPELLEQFAADRGYELVYYEPGPEDSREELAGSLQVDVLSGVTSGDGLADGDFLPLFSADSGGETEEYGVVFTYAAPAGFVRELTEYASSRSSAEITGELLAAVEARQDGAQGPSLPLLIALGTALAVVIAALCVVLRRAGRRERAMERELLTDADTGLLNPEGLERAFSENVTDENRVLWYMLCFHFELGHIERVSGPGEIPRFRRFAADVLRRRATGGEIIALGSNGDIFVLRQADSPETARDWGLDALDGIRDYTCAGAALGHRDAAVGVYPLSSRRHGYKEVLYHARQCAMAACRGDLTAKICAAEQCHVCEEESELLGDLERALAFGELQLNIQFFVSARDFSVTGGEALSRWRHPKRGLLSPDRFIPLLEREDRIEELDYYNLEQVCRFLEQLWAVRGSYFYISCNFSRRSFVRAELLERCREIIERYDFPRRELILEITESGHIRTEEAGLMRANILAVRSLGVQVMFDDFGMGYATFHDLQEYPMDGLKLDKTLVDNMGTVQGRVIVDGIVQTGHKLGLTILAEGVENEWQVEELRKLGCDLLQGYLFAVPVPAAEALKRVSGQDGRG